MKDWLKFAMAWWHTLGQASGDQFGGGTRVYPWDVKTDAVERARIRWMLVLKSWRSWE